MTKAAIPGRVEAVVGRRMSRAERAGRATGDAIVEMVHLMYQNNTAANFWRGFMAVLDEHRRTPPNAALSGGEAVRSKGIVGLSGGAE